MAGKNDQEKTEKPTAKKLAKSREKGQVPKSPEVSSAFIILCATTVLLAAGPWMFSSLMELMQGVFQNLGTLNLQGDSVRTFLGEIFVRFLIIMAPIMISVVVVGIAANVVQVGFLFTMEPLTPKLSKFNPITGMKKFVSLRSLTELIKSVLKILYIGTIAWLVLRGELDSLPSLIHMSVGQIMGFIGVTCLKVMFYVALAMMVLAVIDFTYQRWQHNKDLMMTKQEIKDEQKQSEGDPKVKSRIRQVQREMAARRMMTAIPDADVVITNPTHLAIAIKYDSKEMFAPQIVAKGAGLVAERIKAIAGENDVPVVENKPLAQALFKNTEVDDFVPAELFRAVAEVLAYVYRLKGNPNK
ncbi:MAG: flagellar biosynthesis protein FlhB [Deltaproteobacteria bacterium]|nr:flagellar biosynthesis protein FlhB [Deltaproteobacteria bacterium]